MNIEEEFLTEVETTIKTKAKARKKSINSKQKGSNAEREMAHILTERFEGYKFARSVQSGAYIGASNESRAEDLSYEQKLVFSGDIRIPKNFKFTIEHKFYKEASFWDLFNESSDLHQWFSQALHDANAVKKMPMLVVKYNNHKRIVYLLEDYNVTNINPVFAHRDSKTKKIWYCYNLDDLLELNDDFFFEEK